MANETSQMPRNHNRPNNPNPQARPAFAPPDTKPQPPVRLNADAITVGPHDVPDHAVEQIATNFETENGTKFTVLTPPPPKEITYGAAIAQAVENYCRAFEGRMDRSREEAKAALANEIDTTIKELMP